MALADSIAVMQNGRIEQIGTYAQIRARPVNTFVAGFLGVHPLNLAPATITERGTVAIGGLELPAPHGLVSRKRAGASVIAGIPPEDLAVSASAPRAQSANELHGTVETVEPDFAHRVKYVRVVTKAGLITATEAGDTPLARGQPVAIKGKGAEVHLFGSDNGRNLLLSL